MTFKPKADQWVCGTAEQASFELQAGKCFKDIFLLLYMYIL